VAIYAFAFEHEFAPDKSTFTDKEKPQAIKIACGFYHFS